MQIVGEKKRRCRSQAPERDLTLLYDDASIACGIMQQPKRWFHLWICIRMCIGVGVCGLYLHLFSRFNFSVRLTRVQMSKTYYCRIQALELLFLLMMVVISTEKDYRTITARNIWKNDRDGMMKTKRRAHTLCKENKKRDEQPKSNSAHGMWGIPTKVARNYFWV